MQDLPCNRRISTKSDEEKLELKDGTVYSDDDDDDGLID